MPTEPSAAGSVDPAAFGPGEWADAVGDSPAPDQLLQLYRNLHRWRAQHAVGAALCRLAPDEASWDQLLSSRDLLETLSELAAFVAGVRTGLDATTLDWSQLLQALDREYPNALRAVASLAATWQIPPEDLITVLLQPG